MKEITTRTITGFFMASIAYSAIIFLPDMFFSFLIFLIISVSVYELIRLADPKIKSYIIIYMNGFIIGIYFTYGQPDLQVVIFLNLFSLGIFFLIAVKTKDMLNSFVRDMGVHFLTLFYLFFPLYFLFRLREIGPNFLFFLIFVIAIGDSGAYFVGRLIGKHKIYPIASPKKSFEGLVAAVITAGLSGWLSTIIFPIDVSVILAIFSGAIIGLLSQISDPIESLFKRSAGKKDSGSILPGHGGFLDRVDSYIFCAPALYFIIVHIWKTV